MLALGGRASTANSARGGTTHASQPARDMWWYHASTLNRAGFASERPQFGQHAKETFHFSLNSNHILLL